jgi:hypothetical protein
MKILEEETANDPGFCSNKIISRLPYLFPQLSPVQGGVSLSESLIDGFTHVRSNCLSIDGRAILGLDTRRPVDMTNPGGSRLRTRIWPKIVQKLGVALRFDGKVVNLSNIADVLDKFEQLHIHSTSCSCPLQYSASHQIWNLIDQIIDPTIADLLSHHVVKFRSQ